MQRTFEGILRNVGSGLGVVVFLDGDRLFRVHVLGPLKILFRLQHRRLLLKIGGFGRADGRLLLLEKGFVGIGFYFNKEIAFFYPHPVGHRQLDDFARHFG